MTNEGKTIQVDNYTITETSPTEYLIRKNGTPVATYDIPRGLTSINMKAFLLDYMSRVSGDYLGGVRDDRRRTK